MDETRGGHGRPTAARVSILFLIVYLFLFNVRIPPTQPSMRGFINGAGIGDTVEREHEETEEVDESNRRTIEEHSERALKREDTMVV